MAAPLTPFHPPPFDFEERTLKVPYVLGSQFHRSSKVMRSLSLLHDGAWIVRFSSEVGERSPERSRDLKQRFKARVFPAPGFEKAYVTAVKVRPIR